MKWSAKRFTMRRAIEDHKLLGATLQGRSWQVWRVMLIAAMGELLSCYLCAIHF
jgi:hypothetical protein